MDSRAARDTSSTIDAGAQPTATGAQPTATGAQPRATGDQPTATGGQPTARSHPLRVAMLDLLAGRATLTSTEAARELGESSGACSFHLRQLERYGLVEEAPGGHGRVRPWRLAASRRGRATGPAGPARPADEFGDLARELENEGYRRWLERRDSVPQWHDEAFSAVLYLTPAELTEVAAAIRAVIAARGQRDPRPAGQQVAGGRVAGDRTAGGQVASGQADSDHAAGDQAAGVMPVGVVARMFPLLPASSADSSAD